MATPTRRPGKDRALRICKYAADIYVVASSSNPSRNPLSDDAPPAYTPAPTPGPVSNTVAPPADDAYAFLDTFDTVFLIDDSGSMAGGRWRQTADALMTIAPVCTAHDADGIDIHFLNQESLTEKNVTSASAVQDIFHRVRPGGPTPMGRRLKDFLEDYLEKYKRAPGTTKPVNLIVITDGESHDAAEEVIIDAAKKLDMMDAPAWQVGIQFFQVGNDPKATEYLKTLDDGLVGLSGDRNMRDMVDTVPFTNAEGARLTGDGILKVVLGAVTRRLDRKSKDLHR